MVAVLPQIPTTSYSFPEAIHPNPAVQAFLRGQEKTMTLGGFSGQKAVTGFVQQHMGKKKKKKQKNYFANFVAKDDTSVVITKIMEAVKSVDDVQSEWNECKKFVGDENLSSGVKRELELEEGEIIEQPSKK
ncbi:hypothetical protein HK098_002056 [Nowakowskiella sp. JEL0407]|nr:hypothetical protein HK098_002056 [Nowakowskiella sp. JEL0407]